MFYVLCLVATLLTALGGNETLITNVKHTPAISVLVKCFNGFKCVVWLSEVSSMCRMNADK